MDVNMGTIDRVIRAIVGLGLILAPFMTGWSVYAAQWVVYASVVIGLVLGGTALFATCPMYKIFGLNTRKN